MAAYAPRPGAAYARLGWNLSADKGRHEVSMFVSENLKIGRLHSREGTYTSRPAEGVIRAVFVVEGCIRSTYSGQGFDLETGRFVLLDGEQHTVGETDRRTARFYWEVSSRIFQTPTLRSLLGEPLRIPYAHWQSLVQVSNVVLNNSLSQQGKGVGELASAIAHLMRGLALDGDRNGNDSQDLHRSRLLGEAQSIIEERFHQASFSVGKLARSIRVSEASLRRLFRSMGTSPYVEIQRRRAQHARDLLRQFGPCSAADADEIARSSGFSSRTHMWRTLRRHSEG